MSNQVNTELYERAAEMLDYWTGTIMEKLIQHDIDTGDLESLYHHVCDAEGRASQQEVEASDVA
jgi:hypothetical protein